MKSVYMVCLVLLVCDLLHGCRVVLVWRRWKNRKWKNIFYYCLFVLKWICSLLLRVTTNHLYSLGKCRFTWRRMILCADFFPLVPGELFPRENVCENFRSQDCEHEHFDSQSAVGNQDGEKLFSAVYIWPNVVLKMYFMLFNFVLFSMLT